MLQTAAVVGRTFSEPVLSQVTGMPDDDLGASLRSLRSAEFLQEEAIYPVAEYRFWHPLTQEVAYGSLLGERRARIHAAVASAIAELEPERADERAALLAQHWEAAGNALKAARWNARAGTALRLRDLSEARRRWEATIRLLAGVAESDETLDLGVTARVRLVRLAFRLGAEPEESEALAEEARALAERRGDPVGLALAIYAKGFLLFGLGRLDAAIALLRQAIDQAKEAGHQEAAGVCFMLGYAYEVRGPLSLGLSYIDELFDLAAGDPDFGLAMWGGGLPNYSRFHRAWVLARLGRLAEAAHTADEAIMIARQRSELEVVAWALPVYPLVALLSGDAEGAVGRAVEAVALAEELGSPFHSVLALQALGVAALADRRPTDAVRPMEDALALARRRHVALFEESSLLAFLADAYVLLGERDGALQSAEEAVAVARAQAARVYECQALIAHARALRSAERAGAVRSDLDEARIAIEETGARAWLPFLHEEQARLAFLEGDRSAFHRELRRAQREFMTMGAAGHAARIGAELA